MSSESFHLPEESILIVTGSSLRAEEMDRPLAYYLRQNILDLIDMDPPPCVYVVGDYRFLYETHLPQVPTISIGGPGVNAVAHRWLDALPLAIAVEEDFYIQIEDSDDEPIRASIWGIDHESTVVAVSTFLENHLERFLCASSKRAQRI